MPILQPEKVMLREVKSFSSIAEPLSGTVGWGFILVPHNPCLVTTAFPCLLANCSSAGGLWIDEEGPSTPLHLLTYSLLCSGVRIKSQFREPRRQSLRKPGIHAEPLELSFFLSQKSLLETGAARDAATLNLKSSTFIMSMSTYTKAYVHCLEEITL